MIPSFLLALREGIEAALVIGIILSALNKINLTNARKVVWAGVALAIITSLSVAIALNAIGAQFEGLAEEIFEGSMMILAAGFLTWMIFWMRRHAVSLKSDLEAEVHQAGLTNSQRALFFLSFTTVAREGIELALFLLAAQYASQPFQTLFGALAGLTTAITLGWLIFRGTYRLNLRQFFQVTNLVLLLFAAGLVAHGVHEFNEAGIIPALIEHVWDINFLIPENSTVGLLLTALFGYNGNPSLTEVIAYIAYFLVLGMNIFQKQKLALKTTA